MSVYTLSPRRRESLFATRHGTCLVFIALGRARGCYTTEMFVLVLTFIAMPLLAFLRKSGFTPQPILRLGGLAAGIACRVNGNGKQVQGSRLVAGRECSRLILPYHPCFAKLGVHCANFQAAFKALRIDFVKPVPVFCLGGRSIARRMQGDCRVKLLAHYHNSRTREVA